MQAPPLMTPAGAPAAEAQRRSVRRSAIVFTLIAAGFYFGFIVMMLVRGSK
jgi:hypothetical protein